MLKIRKLYTEPAVIDPIFFEDGINIILGERDITSAKTNGVGKSLCVEFINFALLKLKSQSRVSNIPNTAFDPDTKICLDIEINSQNYTVKRSPIEAERPIIHSHNQVRQFEKLDDATRFVTERVFADTESLFVPSFRKIMGPVIRDERSEFKSIIACYDTRSRIPDDYEPHLFFFGFDIETYDEIREAIKTYEEITKEQARIKQNLILLTNSTIKDAKSELNELDSQVQRIEESIEQLETLVGFDAIKSDIVQLEEQIEQLRLERDLARRHLRQLKPVSKPVKIEISEVTEFYRQIENRLGDIVQKDLNEVLRFKNKIDEFQNNLLQQQRMRFSAVIRDFNNKLSQLEEKYRRLLSVVDQTGNLKNLKQTYAAHKEKSDELAQLRSFVTRFEKLEADKQRSRSNKEALLLALQSMIIEASERIRNFELFVLQMHEFIQGNRKASFDIEVTSNKQVVDFIMRIDDDGSHSVEREKVFIYDVSLLLSESTGKRHPGFLIHDNIFGVDDDTLRRSLEFLYKGDFSLQQQYIITFNEDQLEHVSAGSGLADELQADVRARYTKASRFLKTHYQEIA